MGGVGREICIGNYFTEKFCYFSRGGGYGFSKGRVYSFSLDGLNGF